MQGAAPLGRERLELRCTGRDRLLRRPREVVAQAHKSGALLLALSLEPIGVGRDARLGLRDQLRLLLRQLADLVDDAVLRALEVVVPRVEARLDLLLRPRQGLAELVDGDT